MRGSIQRREGARGVVYRLRVDGAKDLVTGERTIVSETIRGSKRDAQRRLRELIDEIESGGYVTPTDLSVSELLDRWLGTVGSTVRATTLQGYRFLCIRYLKPRLGHHRLQQLTSDHIQAAYADLLENHGSRGKPLSRRTVLHAHRVLTTAMRLAVRANLLGRNPCDRVTPPKASRKEIRTLEPGEASAVFEHLLEHAPWAYWPTALALLTGMRRSEVLGLQWGDLHVDGEHSGASVRRGFTLLASGEEVVGPPKTPTSVRNVALSGRTVGLLREWRTRRDEEARLLGNMVQKTDWVFSDALGRLYRPGSLSQALPGLPRMRSGRRLISFVAPHSRHRHAAPQCPPGRCAAPARPQHDRHDSRSVLPRHARATGASGGAGGRGVRGKHAGAVLR